MDALHSVSPLLCGLAMRKAEHAEDRALEQVGEAEARAEGHRQHRHRRRDRQQRGSAHALADGAAHGEDATDARSEEHTSELQSLMRNSYAVFCLKKKKETNKIQNIVY